MKSAMGQEQDFTIKCKLSGERSETQVREGECEQSFHNDVKDMQNAITWNSS